MSHEYQIQATLSVCNAKTLVEADSAEDAIAKAYSTPLASWDLEGCRIVVHPVHSEEQLATEEAKRQLTNALDGLRKIQGAMKELGTELSGEVDVLLRETGDNEELLRKILGIEKCASKT